MADIDAEDLPARILELEKQVEDLQSQLNDALSANEALVAEFEKAPGPPTPVEKPAHYKTLFFQFEGTKKGFNYPSVYHKNKKITAEQISFSEGLQHELIGMNSGMIKHF